MRTLASKSDTDELVVRFYQRATTDLLIGHFFADLDMAHHLPRIQAFWAMVLLGEPGYHGDTMTAHIRLHERSPMSTAHFERWLELWDRTVDDLFIGNKATEAKQRARTIAAVMAHNVIG